MSVEVKDASVESESLSVALILPPHLTENFEKANGQLRKAYGYGPGVEALVRLWVGCGSAGRIRAEFELAVMGIKKRYLTPDEEGNFDEDCL
jgi:hypothetical protein